MRLRALGGMGRENIMLTLHLEIRGSLEELALQSQQTDCDWQDVDTHINSILGLACEKLEETGIAFFRMSGFGRGVWPVDVCLDLACVLEQLSEAIDAIRQENYPFDLELYEQGIEKTITFTKKDDDGFIEAKCRDFFVSEGYPGNTSWKPDPDAILVEEGDILSQLLNLKSSFIQAVRTICPDLSTKELFTAWCEDSF